MAYKISIAMATYNGEDYLKEQLHSFLKQTSRPNELVVSDDASTDTTLSIVSEAANPGEFEFVLHQNASQLGYAQNFNKALGLTTGDVVFLSDQDDVWLDAKIATIMDTFEQNPNKYLIIHDLEYCDQQLEPIGQTKLERLKTVGASDRSYVTGMATAVRKEFLDVCLPIPNNPLITHDLWLHECARLLNVKRVISDTLALYRRHDSNATGSVLNKGKKVNLFSFISSIDVKQTKVSIERKLVTLRELIKWTERSDVIAFCKMHVRENQEFLREKQVELHQEMVHTKSRLNLYTKNQFQRFIMGIKLYFQDGYDEVMGIKSLMKDILSKN